MKHNYTNDYNNALKQHEIIAVEIFKKPGRTKAEAIAAGLWNIWTAERIQGAFNFHAGTLKDFKEYASNNRAFCWITFRKEATA